MVVSIAADTLKLINSIDPAISTKAYCFKNVLIDLFIYIIVKLYNNTTY